MHENLPQIAPAISVLMDAFSRGTLAHVAVDWQWQYLSWERQHNISREDSTRATFDRAAQFTKDIHSDIPNISVFFRGHAANNPYLPKAKTYGPVFWKDDPSAFDARRFGKYMRDSPYDTLIISGLYSRDCQGVTVFDALRRGYKVLVPTDMVVGPIVMKNRNVSEEPEPACVDVDDDVRQYYFNRYEEDKPLSPVAANLFGIKSYEIVRTLGL